MKKNRQQSKYTWTVDSDATHRTYNKHHEGILPTEGTDDIPQEHFKHLMNIFYRIKVAITEEKEKVIEWQTRNQADDKLWKSERRTASVVGSIETMKASTKRTKKNL